MKKGRNIVGFVTESNIISRRSLDRLTADFGWLKGNTEETTNAQAKAMVYVRNFVSFAAINWLYNQKVKPYMKGNSDATQMQVGHDSSKKYAVYFVKTEKTPLKVLNNQRVPESQRISLSIIVYDNMTCSLFFLSICS